MRRCSAGVRFGPPGSKRLIYFVDDMNMPFVDKYDTQSAIELLRQSLDYKGWFDKVRSGACAPAICRTVSSHNIMLSICCGVVQVKIVLKEVTNIQYSACMNPTAGSFNITPRMQRHFATFAVQMPSMDISRQAARPHEHASTLLEAGFVIARVNAHCRTIYSAILEGHLAMGGFDAGVAKLGPRLVEAMLELHRNVMHNFLPSAIKFHYQFNLRELSNITQARPPTFVLINGAHGSIFSPCAALAPHGTDSEPNCLRRGCAA